MNAKKLFYVLTCISLCIPFGAGLYEHVAVWPHAFAAPPQSLTMFQGNYALESAPFWMTIHPVTVLLFIISLVLNWKTERRKSILIPFIIYFVILMVTSIYFVPELMRIAGTPYADTVDADLQKSAALWTNLSLVRLVVGYAAIFILISGLTKPDTARQS